MWDIYACEISKHCSTFKNVYHNLQFNRRLTAENKSKKTNIILASRRNVKNAELKNEDDDASLFN